MEHYPGTIADPDNFLSFGRKDDDRNTRIRETVNDLIDFLFGADIHTLCRVVEDQHLRVGHQPFCQHDLLLIPAGKAGDEVEFIAHFDPQLINLFLEECLLTLFVNKQSPDDLRQIHDRTVIKDRHILEDGILLPVAGQVSDAMVQCLMRVFYMDLSTVQEDLSLMLCVHRPENRLEQLTASVPEKAGHPKHLSGMDSH